MNLTVKKGLPTFYSDWLSPRSIMGADMFDLLPETFSWNKSRVPSANIKETPKDFLLELAAPGLTRKDFKLEVANHMLSISAEKEEESESEDGYTRKEFAYNAFCRTFTLPENVNADKIDAKYEDGVLKVVIPKVKETPVEKVKHITVG